MKTFVLPSLKIKVDAKDKELLLSHKWWLKDGEYPATTVKGKNLYLHRMIMDFPDGIIDHINRKPLDNRRCNLRVVTKSQNSMNSKLGSNNSSGKKGVSYSIEKKKWHAYISLDGKRKFLGYFKHLNDAIEIREEAEKVLFGEYLPN